MRSIGALLAAAERADRLERELEEQALAWADERVRMQEIGGRQLDQLRERADRLDRQLGNLLAVLHGDGGHYLDEHGADKACADAEARWYALVERADQMAERVAGLEGLLKMIFPEPRTCGLNEQPTLAPVDMCTCTDCCVARELEEVWQRVPRAIQERRRGPHRRV